MENNITGNEKSGLHRIDALRGSITKRIGGEEKLYEWMKYAAAALFSALVSPAAFMLGTYPFALCFAASVGNAGTLAAFLCGSITAIFVIPGGGWMYFAAVCAVSLIRIAAAVLSSGGITGFMKLGLRDSFAARCILAAAASICAEATASLGGGFELREMFPVLFSGVVVSLFTLLLCGMWERPLSRSLFGYAGACTVIFALLLSLRSFDIVGISVAAVIAMIVSLTASHCGNAAFGIASGLVCGIALDVSAAPMYAIAAALYAVLSRLSSGAACLCAAIVSMSWCIYAEGYAAIGGMLPEITLGVLMAFFLIRSGAAEKLSRTLIPELVRHSTDDSEIDIAAPEKVMEYHAKLGALSGALTSLSRTLYQLSGKFTKESLFETKQLCDEVCDKYCAGCARRQLCWEREYSTTAGYVTALTDTLFKKGRIEPADIAAPYRNRCMAFESIINEVNIRRCDRERLRYERDKSTVFAADYEAMARLLNETARGDGELERNMELTREVTRALMAEGICAGGVNVYGKRRLRLTVSGIDASTLALTSEEIHAAVTGALGVPMSIPEFMLGGDVSMEMHAEKSVSADAAVCLKSAADGEMCGDSVKVFENRGGYFYSVVSDGMGSGTDAAITSRLCTVFLERMLRAGCRIEVCLTMLNSLIAKKGGECFATVDIMELDRYSGEARFIKSGAAPSFVIRGGNLFRLQSKTLPVGIVDKIDAEMICFSTMPGDIVVMLSDGITGDADDAPWLPEMLSGIGDGDDLKKTAAAILEKAYGTAARRDDLTVSLIRIRGTGARRRKDAGKVHNEAEQTG